MQLWSSGHLEVGRRRCEMSHAVLLHTGEQQEGLDFICKGTPRKALLSSLRLQATVLMDTFQYSYVI